MDEFVDSSAMVDRQMTARAKLSTSAPTKTQRRADASLHAAEVDQPQLVGTSPVYTAPYVWYVIGLLAVVNLINYMDRTILSVLMPSIKADLKLTDAQLGLLVGFAFFLFYAVCGVPIARWADRGIRKDVIALSLLVWSVMTALSGAVQNFWHLLAARVGLGAGEAGCIPSSQSIIADYIPLRRRPGVYAILGFGTSAGTMCGLVLAGWLGETIGWRWTFVVLGLPGLALAMLVKLTLREPVRGASDHVKDNRSDLTLWDTIVTLWRCRTYRLIAAFLVLNGFAYAGLMQWWPSFYTRVFELSLSSAGLYLGLAIGVGSGIGTISGGILADRAAQRDVRLPVVIGIVAMALALPAALGALFSTSAVVSMVLAFLSILLWSVHGGPLAASLFSVTMPRTRATAGALTTFMISVLGFGLGPFCVGKLSDVLTPAFGAEALRYALLLPVGFIVVLVIALCRVASALPADLAAAGVAVRVRRPK